MTILNTIKEIDASYAPDPDASIDVIGVMSDGREVQFYLENKGDGPVLYPGAWFLPYGGIYYNPLIVSVREDC